MKIVVCMKEIFDPVSVEINSLTGKVNEERLVKIINPADLCALEEAIRIKEKWGGRVTVLSLASSDLDQDLKEAMAKGADEIIRVWDDDWGNAVDASIIAYALTLVLQKLPIDLIFCGDRGDNFQAAEVPAWISEYLGIPLITSVMSLSIQEDKKQFLVKRKLEKGKRQVMTGELPVVLAVTEFINQPRECALLPFLDSHEIRETNLSLKMLKRMIPQDASLEVFYEEEKLRPKPQLVFTPDCHLPYLERIDAVISGDAVNKATEFIDGSPEVVAGKIIDLLIEEKILTS